MQSMSKLHCKELSHNKIVLCTFLFSKIASSYDQRKSHSILLLILHHFEEEN